jgi:hypothetical protein
MKSSYGTYAKLKEKYGENWGIQQPHGPRKPSEPAPTKEELAAHYAKHDLAFKRKYSAKDAAE